MSGVTTDTSNKPKPWLRNCITIDIKKKTWNQRYPEVLVPGDRMGYKQIQSVTKQGDDYRIVFTDKSVRVTPAGATVYCFSLGDTP